MSRRQNAQQGQMTRQSERTKINMQFERNSSGVGAYTGSGRSGGTNGQILPFPNNDL